MDKRILGKIARKGADERYFSVTSVWPFNFFPDSIEMDDQKVVVIRRGFLTRKVITIQLVDLFNVELLEAPLFCTVRVIGKYVTGGHEDIPFVRKHEAQELHRRVTSLLARKENPDQSGGQ